MTSTMCNDSKKVLWSSKEKLGIVFDRKNEEKKIRQTSRTNKEFYVDSVENSQQRRTSYIYIKKKK